MENMNNLHSVFINPCEIEISEKAASVLNMGFVFQCLYKHWCGDSVSLVSRYVDTTDGEAVDFYIITEILAEGTVTIVVLCTEV